MASLAVRAAARVLVGDGGLATALEARGHDLTGGLWSARLLAEAPSEIAEVHRDFYRAGADIVITASYQASFRGFSACGIGRRGAEQLMRRSVSIAAAVRDEFHERFVAASIGPYGAVLADGSEYRGRYGLSVRELRAWHRPRFEILATAGADVLALETVPDIDEAQALVDLATEAGMPAWLTYTTSGTRTRAGQSLADAFSVAADSDAIIAVGVNCCAPDDVLPAIAAARSFGKPVIVYPNSGEGWDSAAAAWTGTSTFTPQLVRAWIAAGAAIVGGCCRVDAASIAQLPAVIAEDRRNDAGWDAEKPLA